MIQEKNKHPAIIFITCLLFCVGGGWLAGLLTQKGINDWYPALLKPKGTPPNIVFPVVWTVLYIFMAISSTLLFLSKTTKKKFTFICFGIQLILNFTWSFLFFYLKNPSLALIDMGFLWLFVALTMGALSKHTLYGSYLFLPYLCWISYAFYLNLFIWLNN